MMQRAGDFLAGKGFYIVLFLCVAAIGISGYYLFSGFGGEDPQVMVSAPAEIVINPSPKVTEPPVPSPLPSPTPTVTPSPSATPSPKPSQSTSPRPSESTVPSRPAALVFTWPVKGLVERDFSLEALAYDETMADWRTHSGMDINAALGTQVFAAAAGTVTEVYQDDLMGTVVTIDHGSGLTSSYANLAATPTVELGDKVETGGVIGAVGSTAIAESILPAHLHFEMSKDGVEVDPANYLPMLP